MESPRWQEFQERWAEYRGALIDVYVRETIVDDWQRVRDAFSSRWPSSYSEDGNPAELPSDVGAVFRRSSECRCLWSIQFAASVLANCHFFEPDEIEFDLDPRQIRSQADFDAICDFVQAIGRTLGKSVGVCVEGGSRGSWDVLRYDSALDRVFVPPPGQPG